MKGVTSHQLEVLMGLVQIEQSTGRLADFDQVLAKLSWKPTKESAQFTIRALVVKGLIEKVGLEARRGRNRVCYRNTGAGRSVLDPREPEHVPEDTSLVPGSLDSFDEPFWPEMD